MAGSVLDIKPSDIAKSLLEESLLPPLVEPKAKKAKAAPKEPKPLPVFEAREDLRHLPIETFTSKKQRINLQQLASYLWNLPKRYGHFDMSSYHDSHYRPDHVTKEIKGEGLEPKAKYFCGTSACAAGHGPYAGIDATGFDDWGNYGSQQFGADGVAWTFWFDGDWDRFDNTPHGAAKRIAYSLQHGIPQNYSKRDFEEGWK